MDPESPGQKKCSRIAASFCPSNAGSTLLVTNLFPQSLDQQHHIEMDKHQTHHLLDVGVSRCIFNMGHASNRFTPMSIKIKIRDLSSSLPKPCILEGDFDTYIPIFELTKMGHAFSTSMPQLNWKHHPSHDIPKIPVNYFRLEKVGARTVRSPLMTFSR